MNIKTFFLLVGFLSLQILPSFGQDDKAPVRMDSKSQTLSFFINDEGELNAKLAVKLQITSQTALTYRYKQAVFFDNDSKVQNIIKRTQKKKKIKVSPILSDYESEGVFHSDLKLCYFDHTFSTKNEWITIEYEKIFTDVKFLDPLYFNDRFPVRQSEITIEQPSWMELTIEELNFDKEKPILNNQTTATAEVSTYKLSDLESHSNYYNAPRRNKLNAHLILVPNSYEVNGKKKELIQDVSDLYAWYASLVGQIGNESGGLEALVATLTADQTDDLEKIKSIFYWVQDNIRYIAFEDGIMGFKPESCQKVFDNRYGDCKGMANLTKQMLTIAGYDARLTWLGTNDLPYSYSIPSPLVDNHMICTVLLNGEKIYLDATDKYSDLYNYGQHIRGKEVLIEDGEQFMIDTIPAGDIQINKERYEHEFELVEDKLVGNGSYELAGNRKTNLLYALSTIPEKEWDKNLKVFLKNDDKNIQLKILNKPKLENRDQNPVFEYDITVANQVIDLGQELYVNPEIEYEFFDYEMPEDRSVPFEFSSTYFIEQETTLRIPESWSVQYLPDPLDIQHEKYRFSLKYKKEAGKIRYTKTFEIRNPMLVPGDFQSWNKAIEQVTSFYSDQIILQKQ